MNLYENNQRALCFLNQQDWENAQKKLFDNAKKFPCYQTYNNLGHFLISEGLICKNGIVRNSIKLGLNYLIKSGNIKRTSTNAFALINVLYYKMRFDADDCKKFEEYIYQYTKEVLKQEYSLSLHYNHLCVKYFLNDIDDNDIIELRNIVCKKTFTEAIYLYISILQEKSHAQEAIKCIEKYRCFLDDFDLFVFYSKLQKYKEAYDLCDKVYELYSLNEFVVVAIIESCLANKDIPKAERYSKDFFDNNKKDKKYRDFIFSKSKKSMDYRSKVVSEYKYNPSFVEECAYFGCPIHQTKW